MNPVAAGAFAVPSPALGQAPEAEHVAEGAWQREMERAQAQAWFRGALPIASTSDPPSARDKPHGAPERGNAADRRYQAGLLEPAGSGPMPSEDANKWSAYQMASGAAPLEAATTAPGPGALGLPEQAIRSNSSALPADEGEAHIHSQLASAEPRVAPRATPAGELLEVVPAEPATAADEETRSAPQVPQRATARASERVPVRWHCEAIDGRLTVWVGIDAHVREQFAGIAQAVARWSATTGYGLARLICNGELVDRAVQPSLCADERSRPTCSSSDRSHASRKSSSQHHALGRKENT